MRLANKKWIKSYTVITLITGKRIACSGIKDVKCGLMGEMLQLVPLPEVDDDNYSYHHSQSWATDLETEAEEGTCEPFMPDTCDMIVMPTAVISIEVVGS